MTDDLLTEYRRLASDHGRFTLSGDADRANSAYDRLRTVYRDLESVGSLRALIAFRDDADPWVQIWSSAHTLRFDAPGALLVLENLLTADAPLVGLTARSVIDEWARGTLTFPSN
ncbi:MAG: hypothetical protein ACAI43_15735 [Phycisphaerae bacterium]|nr:hypothetical protein [Tepidisphaeraceae bacterium]